MRKGRCYIDRPRDGETPPRWSSPSHWWYVTEADEGPPLDAQDYFSEITKKQCQKVCDKDKYCTGFQVPVEDKKAKCIIFYESGPFDIINDELVECHEKETSLLPAVPPAVAVDAGQGYCHTADDQSLVVPKVIQQVENEDMCNIMCVKTKGCAGYNYGDDIEHKCRLWMTNKRVEGIMEAHAYTHCKVVRQKDGEWDFVAGSCTIVVQSPEDFSWYVGLPFGRYYQEDLYNDDDVYSAHIALPECKEHCDEDPQCIAFSSVREGKGRCMLHYEDGEWHPRDDQPEQLCYMRRKKLEPEPRYELVGDGVCVGSKDENLKKVIFRGGKAGSFADKNCQEQCDRTNNCHGWSVRDKDRTICRIYLEPIISFKPFGHNSYYEEPCMRRIFNNLRAVDVAGSVGGFQNYFVVGGAIMTLAVVGAAVASLRRKVVKEEGNPLLAA